MEFMWGTGVVLTLHGEDSFHLINFKSKNPCYDPYQLCHLTTVGQGFQCVTVL